MFTIGKLAALAGTTPNALRYYERERLIPTAAKGENGYRRYPHDTVKAVRFIRQAQQCGFTLAEIRRLQAIPTLASACCSDVRRLAVDKKQALEVKMSVMQAMIVDLDMLIRDCDDDGRGLADCPILSALNSEPALTDR